MCRDLPGDGKGCHYWTYYPQNKTCLLLNSCDKENADGAISGTRECAPIPTNEFSVQAYTSGGGARADASVDWQNFEYCPSQDSGPIFESVGPVFIPYYDFCGSYNTSTKEF